MRERGRTLAKQGESLTKKAAPAPRSRSSRAKRPTVAVVVLSGSTPLRRNKAAELVYQSVRANGHQREVVDIMQTREELYDRIGYHAFEGKLDALFAAKK